jgi:anti-sigma regulatory factor (Ser/Thr protein kinase)
MPLEQTLENDPRAPGTARRCVGRFLAEAALDVPDAMLVVSELVTNAVQHSHGEITLRAAADGNCLRLEVGDRSPVAHLRAGQAGVDDETGRGLALVDALSTRWGWSSTTSGTHVWAELPLLT